MKQVVVVGGGAAGMIAALSAAWQGADVALAEKNEKLGKKLFITGKGRCNVTNAAGREQFLENVCTNEKFLYSAFHGFDNQALMAFLEKAGCPLKLERGERVFPASDHSSDVIAAFVRQLGKAKVDIMLNTRVTEILCEGSRVTGVRLAGGRQIDCDACIVCTGGISYPSTGSTGDGYRFAESLGHKVTECRPALVPLETEEKWCGVLMGLSLKNVGVRLVSDKKVLYQGFGEMLFTHFGVSGPLILSASSFYGKHSSEKRAKLFLDLKPALSLEQLDKRLLRDFEENKNRQFKNALGALFPVKMIPVMVELSGINPEKKVNEITRQERRSFAELMKNLPLTVAGTRSFEEAIITQGGVSVREVNSSTMESRKVGGLYFAGEVLDLDALTGGYNLQIAWSTGYLAGKNAASEKG
ncbi:MAG: NAD(P)/FAD-dependent oxidoreductase [Roseburia sp.]|nr:NAD(P)/FAD-dependent oxidoreductase [Roseburia sp.]